MKKLTALIIALVTAAGIWYAADLMLPRTQTQEYRVCKMVPEIEITEKLVKVEIDGEFREVRVPVEYTVAKSVYETRIKEILPMASDWLKFGIVLAVAIFVWIYMLCVLYMWARDMTSTARESERVRDVRSRLNGILGFAFGIMMGFIGGKYLTTPDLPMGAYAHPTVGSEYVDPDVDTFFDEPGLRPIPAPAPVTVNPPIATPLPAGKTPERPEEF